tara:strand:- start:56 stop:664 length:609 start_codon:yes stop_codon:yes gene_type:complete
MNYQNKEILSNEFNEGESPSNISALNMEDDDCPVCLDRLPNLHGPNITRNRFMCCGKELCSGCFVKLLKRMRNDRKCVCLFCRHDYGNSISGIRNTCNDLLEKNVREGRSWAQFSKGNRLVRISTENENYNLDMLNSGIELLIAAERKNYVRAMFTLAALYDCNIGEIPDRYAKHLYLKIMNNCTETELLFAENVDYIQRLK